MEWGAELLFRFCCCCCCCWCCCCSLRVRFWRSKREGLPFFFFFFSTTLPIFGALSLSLPTSLSRGRDQKKQTGCYFSFSFFLMKILIAIIFIYLFYFVRVFVTRRTERHAPHVIFTRLSYGSSTRAGLNLLTKKQNKTIVLSLLERAYVAVLQTLRSFNTILTSDSGGNLEWNREFCSSFQFLYSLLFLFLNHWRKFFSLFWRHIFLYILNWFFFPLFIVLSYCFCKKNGSKITL